MMPTRLLRFGTRGAPLSVFSPATNMRSFCPSLIAFNVLFACGHADEPATLGQLEQPIVFGQSSESSSEDGVVYILSSPPGLSPSFCTGTLIAPNLVATALHCVTYTELGFFSCAADGSVEPVNPGDGNVGALAPPDKVEIFMGTALPPAEPAAVAARLLGTGSTQICRNDLAFIVLDRALDAPIAAVRLSGEMTRSESVRVVGYGQTEVDGARTARVTRAGVRIVDVGPTTDGAPTGTAAPRTFVVNEGPCHGDSGGPAFSEETGALLGVYSLAAGPSCTGVGIRNVYTSLAPFSGLALQAFEAAGAEPQLEEAEPEPERPPVVPEQGCSLVQSPRPASPASTALLTALMLGALWRSARRRSY